MRVGIGLRSLDQGSYGGGRRIENADLVAFYHFPEAARIRISRYAFEDDLRQAGSQGSVCNIGMAGYPAHIGRAPEHVLGPGVEIGRASCRERVCQYV